MRNGEESPNLDGLKQELRNLKIAVGRIETSIRSIETRTKEPNSVAQRHRNTRTTKRPNSVANKHQNTLRDKHTIVRDRDGSTIQVGDRVEFLTTGKYTSKTGSVTKISANGQRVISVDSKSNIIPRAPYNVRVLKR